MKILLVTSEVTPLAKTGGLADVTFSLAVELKRLGHDVRLFMPLYGSVQNSGFLLRKARKSVEIEIAGHSRKGLLRQATVADMPVYLLENREFFDREFLYGPPEGPYPDNHLRFAFFCRGLLEAVKKLDFRPDILHCHDWQSALVPILLRHEHRLDPFYSRCATLFTIQNLAYQGVFPLSCLENTGFSRTPAMLECLEHDGQINLMKGAILSADLLTTVSRTYCSEILTPEFGRGLDQVLAVRAAHLTGIRNGLDLREWNPATDRKIFRQYSGVSLSGKERNKRELQRIMGLDMNPHIPLVAIVSRLTEQKGIDLVEKLMPRFAGAELQLVILGTGDSGYMQHFSSFARMGSSNISINLAFDQNLAHQIYAGADMFLMPSYYEPCGLSQMIALRYGAVPVVRKTGGLADTVFDQKDGVDAPNGFCFSDYSTEALWQAVSRALALFGNKSRWRKLIREGMAGDYSWETSARCYESLYLRAMEMKRG